MIKSDSSYKPGNIDHVSSIMSYKVPIVVVNEWACARLLPRGQAFLTRFTKLPIVLDRRQTFNPTSARCRYLKTLANKSRVHQVTCQKLNISY